jgi:hypothetical protein
MIVPSATVVMTATQPHLIREHALRQVCIVITVCWDTVSLGVQNRHIGSYIPILDTCLLAAWQYGNVN